MVAHISDQRPLVERVADRVLESTYGRIRGLAVEQVHDDIVVRGEVPSHHMRQLALEGALKLVPIERCRPFITVGMSRS